MTNFREEATSALLGFHAGLLSWPNWNLEMLDFVEGGKPSEHPAPLSMFLAIMPSLRVGSPLSHVRE